MNGSRPAMAPVLEVRDASKRFGAVVALDGISVELYDGEVLAVLGDNGAGKSTLIKSISGAQALDEGTILIDGEESSIKSPTNARACGIETVYQDLALFDNLSVVDNFFAGRELVAPKSATRFGKLRTREMTRRVQRILAELEVNVPDVRLPVGLLSGGQRQAIAVARAVSFAARVVILDEPTAALGVRETRSVLRLVKRLPERGLSVILISHNLDQVSEVADRAVVMRRGSKVGEAIPSDAEHDRIVGMIVGAQTMN